MTKLYHVLLTAALVLVILAVIFHFSSQPGSESQAISGGFVDVILEWITDGEVLPEEELTEMRDDLNFLVRKTAHFLEYAALGCSLLLHLRVVWLYRGRKIRFLWLPAWVLSFLCASLDEFNQSFSGARSPLFKDVLIDSAGAAAGILFCILVWKNAVNRAERRRHAE